ncbi:MAG: FAD-dependent oxidoreductase [Candidatus Omnitrophica bacterium]|jgi:protoporphyrinogen oxidase|nr:FAD-dependent oxidoreductase [Candidatus Omnitrophota bacterium]
MIGILGGGLSAVSLQHFLFPKSQILEKDNALGGLCRSFKKDGFSYDLGGHILFSKDKAVLGLIKRILGNNIHAQRRNNKIFYKGRFVKYPFENGLGILDKEDVYDCLMGVLRNNYPKPKDFFSWMYYNFGDGITEKYLLPYNNKIWKFALDKMSLDWVGRLPRPPIDDIVKSALGIETEGYLHQLNFFYPRHGGIQSLISAFAGGKQDCICGFNIKKISRRRKEWLVSDGKNIRPYNKIVITFAVAEALRMMENVPLRVMQAAKDLRYNCLRVVLIGIKNRSLLDKSAIYIPDKDILAHRVCFMGYFSQNNVPLGNSSLVAEVTAKPGSGLAKVSNSLLIEKIVKNLSCIGIIDKKDIVTTDIKNLPYGYVIHDRDRQKNMKIIRSFFDSLGIKLLGRFAEFEYINMDQVVARSRSLASKMNLRKL